VEVTSTEGVSASYVSAALSAVLTLSLVVTSSLPPPCFPPGAGMSVPGQLMASLKPFTTRSLSPLVSLVAHPRGPVPRPSIPPLTLVGQAFSSMTLVDPNLKEVIGDLAQLVSFYEWNFKPNIAVSGSSWISCP
jgi:hypothetical protein